ncbi:MAG: WS/DGAT domain-containing protein [Myxococcota bacterium]
MADARARLVSLRAASERSSSGAAADAGSLLHELAALATAAAAGRRADLVAVELTGPPSDSSLLGARLRAAVPILPQFAGHALGVTVTQFGERVTVGLSSDAARLPDLSALTDAVAAAFDELRRVAAESGAQRPAARVARPRPRRRAQRRAEAEVR